MKMMKGRDEDKEARDIINEALAKEDGRDDLVPMVMDPLVRSFLSGGTIRYTRDETRYYDGAGNLLGKGPAPKMGRRP